MDTVVREPVSVALREDLKLAGVFAVAAALATMAVLPYALALMPEVRAKLPVSMPVLMLLQGLQGGLLLGLMAIAGLCMGHRVGLDAPWLRALVMRRELPQVAWITAVMAGIASALAILGLLAVIDPWLPTALAAHGAPPAPGAGLGLLASFYGAIGEELQLRLFLMTFLVWIVAKWRAAAPSALAYWIAIVVAALLFGAGHLPAASHVWPLTGLVIARVILANALAGVVFGWLYWRKGLEAAMLAHFSADIVLHVAAPLWLGALA
ncbi:CPBP family intramembrane glutamic endopeptidase [Arenimonas oryziterrae]|uniref:CAAX prenyl protease 2/Lysostaphin resistance protein A-like domain-containing protein n=1 Tax=Arenimonas oryziterrae DSM 21050 = YC6267 TaxID=1121015 RepID=A0A091B1I4_9GAMM|nr:CPBP family intramembrane glutamic endopeptidase [Arenimonas oryziterrae]KFN44769.1 hypothetical protein N789_01790 [Arenimonas oryziterrae DSM 21050 = YC6267]